MGNRSSGESCSDAEAAQTTDQPQREPVRGGAAGLLDLGYAFRFVPCRDHIDRRSEAGAYSAGAVCFECSTNLFHVESGAMITGDDWGGRLRGRLFDEVARASQEVAAGWLERDLGLSFVRLFDDGGGKEPVRALVSDDYRDPQKATLLIVTGKGKSRVGVLSVKHLIESGFEKGSALFHVLQADARGMEVVLLDPNARGADCGMEVVRRSLDRLALRGPLYVLAHSAAGGYLVRYLLHDNSLMDRIRGLVFTDSTHNVQWCRDDRLLMEFLQGPNCLYVRNNSERPSDTFASHKNKKAGEAMRGDEHWIRRFGSIQTVYAGTDDHSFMCYQARHVIWDFFDDRRAASS